MKSINQTIVAPLTSLTNQAVSLIRISGDDAFDIVNGLLKKPLKNEKGVFFKKLFSNGVLIDEVIITSFVKPKSFTGEDVVEISCHGGVLNTQKIIKLIIEKGARMAERGEFSQRAFLNNKINLIQAEGINDLIFAKNDLALKIGVNNMSGLHNESILILKEELLNLISKIQVSIDYPDYDDVEGSTIGEIIYKLKEINEKVEKLLRNSRLANKTSTGIKTAIVGKTNVGKSSLLNTLLQEDKAIVTEIEGTTRDVVTGFMNLKNVSLELIDTAGFRKTKDVVEKIGIKKSIEAIEKSEFIIFVLNKEQVNDAENLKIYEKLKNKNFLIVINKSDLISEDEKKDLNFVFGESTVFTDALSNNLDDLILKIEEKLNAVELNENDSLILINLEQINLVEQIYNNLSNSLSDLQKGFPIDIANVNLNAAWRLLNELIGEEYDDEIIDNIFKKYCLGK